MVSHNSSSDLKCHASCSVAEQLFCLQTELLTFYGCTNESLLNVF